MSDYHLVLSKSRCSGQNIRINARSTPAPSEQFISQIPKQGNAKVSLAIQAAALNNLFKGHLFAHLFELVRREAEYFST